MARQLKRRYLKKGHRLMGLWLFILLLLSVEVFNLNAISGFLNPNACFGFSLGILFLLFTFFIRIPVWDIGKSMWPVIWIMIGTALTFIPAYYYYGQDFSRSFLTNRHMFMIWMVPVLYSIRPTLREIRQAFYAFTILYFVLSLVVTFVDPYLIPHSEVEPFVEEGDFVHILPGIRLLVIALILALNECRKHLTTKNLVMAVFIFGVIFMVQNRTALLTALIVIFLAIRRTGNARARLIGIAFGILLGVILVVYTATQWDLLIQRTIEELSDPEYNRNKAYAYMFAERNLTRYILGDGFISTYSNPLMTQLQESGIFFSDVGMIGFWNQYGLIPTIALLVFFFKGLAAKRGYVVNSLSIFFIIGIPSLSYFGMYATLVPLSIAFYLYFVMYENPHFDARPRRIRYDIHAKKGVHRSISSV